MTSRRSSDAEVRRRRTAPDRPAVQGPIARRWAVLFGLLAALFVGPLGCTSTSETTAPVAPPDTFSAAGTQAVPDRWWTVFDSERLNALVDTATASNFTLRSAWQRLQAARAVVKRESGALYPDLEASGRAEQRGGTEDAFAVGGNLELGLSSVYEVDLWGRVRARVEAERLRAAATRADYQAAALSLSAEVVRTWVQLAAVRSQRRLIEAQIETNTTVLNLLRNRFETGQIRSPDILRQRQLIESTREQRAAVESRVQVLEHRLAVLLGRSPQAGVEALPDSLPTLPPLPEAGVPTDLVRRRPDVRRAFNRLRAADRDLAAAISDQYPRLTLSASGSTIAGSATDLFETWAYSFAGNLLAPIFRGGELRAEVDRAEAARTQRLYEYGQTILTAFREVEDALARERQQRVQIQRLEEQVDLAQRSYQQLRVQYLNGTGDYLDVLTALDEVQQLRRNLLSAERTLVLNRIALYRALAGAIGTDRARR
ncbi:MAG: efflux transporter outer membrane subunit [Salinibacter sp.]